MADKTENALDLELAKSVGIYFRLNEINMNRIIDEVHSSVSGWQRMAAEIGISRGEQNQMVEAFRVE